MDLPFKRHCTQVDEPSKDHFGHYGFLRVLQARNVQIWTALQFLFWCGMVAAVGVFIHQVYLQATALASKAATGVTFLGPWATLAYICRGLRKKKRNLFPTIRRRPSPTVTSWASCIHRRQLLPSQAQWILTSSWTPDMRRR